MSDAVGNIVGHITLDCYIDELVQERRNSSVLAMEVHLSCTKPLIFLLLWFNAATARQPSNLIAFAYNISPSAGLSLNCAWSGPV